MTLPAENREREIEEACCYSILCVSRLLFLINEHFVCGENKMHNKMAEYMYINSFAEKWISGRARKGKCDKKVGKNAASEVI